MQDGSWVCLRPSGTEPKLKIYAGVRGLSLEGSKQALAELLACVEETIQGIGAEASKRITFDYSQALGFIGEQDITALQPRVSECHKMLHYTGGAGSDYLGWVGLPNSYDRTELGRLKAAAKQIRQQTEAFVVIGIGGSYLGARAALRMLKHTFHNELAQVSRSAPRIYFAGHNISATYLRDLLDLLDGQDIALNVISKSGTTTEPAMVFRVLREYMENRYGRQEASKRIYVTTGKGKSALRELAEQEGYESFVVPDNVGGRYSVLTPVGLLPMAVAGIDVDEVMRGGQAAAKDLSSDALAFNAAYQYAAIRNLLYAKGKTTEILVSYEPSLFYFGEWYKQLFGESEGKEGKGIFPTSLNYTTDLHSMGQYVQDGRRNIFETVLDVEKSRAEIVMKEDKEDLDGLNYLGGKTLGLVNEKAREAAMLAHVAGGVPNLFINIPELSPYYFGYLAYFFQKACAMSGLLLGVNPFDQPGVEAYKANMFRLLGKPGYEDVARKEAAATEERK